MLKHIFTAFPRCIGGQYFYFFIGLAYTLYCHSVKIDLSMPCLGPCVNTIIETRHDACFGLFP